MSEPLINDLSLYINRGIAPKYTEDKTNSIIVINQKCIRDYKVDLEDSRLHDLKLSSVTKEKILNKYDILINSTGVGTLGRVAQYYGETGACTIDSHVTIVRPNSQIIDPIYFGYLIKSKQKTIESFSEGTTGQTELSRDAVKGLKLKIVEDKKIQKIISNILKALDDKIENNRQMNEILEKMAQAIFKSWFVDFEPVKAKASILTGGGSIEDATIAAMQTISGKSADELNIMQSENHDEYLSLKHTAEAFPSSFTDSPLGLIPEGWKVKKIDECYNVTMGQSPSGETYNENRDGALFYQGRAEFGWRFPSPRMHTTDPKRMAKSGDILLSVRAPVGDMNIALDDCCVGRGLSALKHKNGSTTYSYYQINSIKAELDRFNGDGTVFGSINQKDLKNISILEPLGHLQEQFILKCSNLDEMIKNLSLETLSLTQVRDTLLPKLLSGEIDVSNLGDK